MNVNYTDKPDQSEEYDPSLWNSQDANEVKNAVNSKVDAVSGKTLTTNDYTTAEKNKLAGLSAETTTSIKTKLGAATELTDGYLTSENFNVFSAKVDSSSLATVATTGNYNDLTNKPSGGAGINDSTSSTGSTYSSAKVTTLLSSKADLVSGTIPTNQLPNAVLSGDQFESLPDGSIGIKTSYLQSIGLGGGGQASAEDYLKSLPGYDIDKILYSDLTWGPIPAGDLEKLSTPTLTRGTISVNAVAWSWSSVANATTYRLERDTTISFSTATAVFTGLATSYTDTGLNANTTYYWRLKASASGFAASDYVNGTGKTLASGNIVPDAPTGAVVNDTANTFAWTNSVGYSDSDHEYTLNGGTSRTGVTVNPINVGNVALASGQVGVRVKAASGRDASSWLFNASPFTVTLITPAAPTNGIVNDSGNTWTVTPPSGYTGTDLETSINSGVTWVANSSTSFNVGNVDLAIGAVRTRVKAASGRNAGAYLANSQAFTQVIVEDFNYVSTPAYSTGMSFDGGTGTLTATTYNAYALFKEYIPAGQTGVIQGIGRGLNVTLSTSTAQNGHDWEVGISRNTGNARVEYWYYNAETEGEYEGSLTPFDNSSANAILRIRFKATTIEFSYSDDDGATFLPSTPVSVPRAAGIDYYYYVTNIYGFPSTSNEQVKVAGFNIDNGL